MCVALHKVSGEEEKKVAEAKFRDIAEVSVLTRSCTLHHFTLVPLVLRPTRCSLTRRNVRGLTEAKTLTNPKDTRDTLSTKGEEISISTSSGDKNHSVRDCNS